MKRYGYLFEQIVDKDNIRKAHKNARRGKRKYKEVQIVDEDIETYVDMIHTMLMDGTFTTSQYEIITKNDKGKEREIYKLPYFPDRIVQHAMMQVLEPIWKNQLIKQTYQSIKGRGVHKALKDLQAGLTDDTWVVKVDIRKYYPSINNDKLYATLVAKLKCVRTKELIADLVYSTVGVPIGNYTSQYFGNLYLSKFDREIQKDCATYSRYCDDVVCLCSDKATANRVLQRIETLATLSNLVVKQCKQVWALLVRPIDYLGYMIHNHYTLVRDKIVIGYRSAIANKDSSIINGYNGWLTHGNCHNLRIN